MSKKLKLLLIGVLFIALLGSFYAYQLYGYKNINNKNIKEADTVFLNDDEYTAYIAENSSKIISDNYYPLGDLDLSTFKNYEDYHRFLRNGLFDEEKNIIYASFFVEGYGGLEFPSGKTEIFSIDLTKKVINKISTLTFYDIDFATGMRIGNWSFLNNKRYILLDEQTSYHRSSSPIKPSQEGLAIFDTQKESIIWRYVLPTDPDQYTAEIIIEEDRIGVIYRESSGKNIVKFFSINYEEL